MQIQETTGISFKGSIENPPMEDVVILVDSAGVALGVRRAFNPRVHDVRDGGRGVIASAFVAGGRARERTIADIAPLVVHDINNLLAVIGSGLRMLEGQDDAAYRNSIVHKMQEAIMRGALLSRRLLDAARPCPTSMDGFVAGRRFAAMAGTLDLALRPDVTVRTEIAHDLWDFNADPEELYFALLNLCRNADDAMPNGGAITVAARNVEPSAGTVQGFVEIVVADDGEGMTEDVLSQAFSPYFTTKAAGSGTGLGLADVRRFAEGRGGTISIESERGAGTTVRLFLPRVVGAAVPSGLAGTEIAYTPLPNGGVFYVVKPEIAALTS